MPIVARYARRTILMAHGQILADGPTRSVFAQTGILAEAFVEPPQITRLAQAGRPEPRVRGGNAPPVRRRMAGSKFPEEAIGRARSAGAAWTWQKERKGAGLLGTGAPFHFQFRGPLFGARPLWKATGGKRGLP